MPLLRCLVLIFCLWPIALKADILAAINTQSGAASSSVAFFDATSLTLTSSFSAPVILEGITFGPAGNDVYVSSGNTVYHYDGNGNLVASGTVGNSDIVELSYYNGALYAATNTGSASQIAILDPATLNVVGGFDVCELNPLTGISVTGAGIYVTGGQGIELLDFSGNVLDSGPPLGFGPVSAVPGAVFTSIGDPSGYTIAAVLPDLSNGFPITSTPGPPGIAAIDPDDFFLSDAQVIFFLSDINPNNGYVASETDNFGNLAYSAIPEPGTFVLMGIAGAGLLIYRKRT
jgi:hypothetical protein